MSEGDKATKIVDEILSLSYMEVVAVVDELKSRTGIEGMAMPMGGMVAQAAAAPVEEEAVVTDFDVILEKVADDKKIAAIKVLREVIPGLGIKEAKEMIGELPAKVNSTILNKEDAEALVAKLSEHCSVAIKPA